MNAVIALNPQEMQEAQTTTLQWADERIAEAQADVAEAAAMHDELTRMGLRGEQANAISNKARKRLSFYEKVKAALAAGYYIIPPFPVQLFAVRTDRVSPPDERGQRTWEKGMNPPALPIGKGDYVDPRPDRVLVDTIQEPNFSGQGTHAVRVYENGPWKDALIPVKALRPQLIVATGEALKLRIFDALGIAPAYRSADPIIVGHIKHWQASREPLTFFVAWWLDKSDL